MPKRGFETLIDIMEFMKKRYGKKKKISLLDLEFAIKRIAGFSKETVEKYKKELREFRWIGTDGINILIFWKRYEDDLIG